MVNGAIKRAMGKPRGDVNLGDHEEMWVWGDGYDITRDNMEDLEDPIGTAYDSFILAQKVNGWLSWEE